MAPPYSYIVEGLKKGNVIPFLGSASSFVGIPDTNPKKLPDGKGLVKEIIESIGGYPGNNKDPLTKVSQYCDECSIGRIALYNYLRKRFYSQLTNEQPPPLVSLIAQIISDDKREEPNRLVITTNYDSHLENALELLGKPYTVITHITNEKNGYYGYILVYRSNGELSKPMDPRTLLLDDYLGDTIIYKLHGTFGEYISLAEDSIIITEEDYISFILMNERKGFPPALQSYFQNNHILFLGYSLEDWNLRVLLKKIYNEGIISWALQKNVSKVEYGFWLKKNVAVFEVDLLEFITLVKLDK